MLLQDLESLQQGGVGVVESRVQGVRYREGQVVFVKLNQGRAERNGMAQTDGKGIGLVLKPSGQLSEAEREHLHRKKSKEGNSECRSQL